MSKKKKKKSWEIVIKDRFLTNEKPDNPYVTVFLYFIVFLLSFLLVFVCFFQLCEVNGESMRNSLQNGEHVLLLKTSKDYKRGDIVVISKKVSDINGKESDSNIIKRIIGTEGDVLRFVVSKSGDGQTEYVDLYRKVKGSENFVKVNEDYILERMKKSRGFSSDFPFSYDNDYKDIEIPESNVFVMGDNRNNSKDSRTEDGMFYPIESIYGKSVLTVKKDSLLEWVLKLLYHEKNPAYDKVGQAY